MPIRPIDMISIAPRSQEASQQHVNDQNRALHAQDNMAQQFSKHVKEHSEVVTGASQSEKSEYRYDAKEKGNGQYGGSKKQGKKQTKDEKKKQESGPNAHSSFDIKI